MTKILYILYISGGLTLSLYLFAGVAFGNRFDLVYDDQTILVASGIMVVLLFILALKTIFEKNSRCIITAADIVFLCYSGYIAILLSASDITTRQWLEFFILLSVYLYFRYISSYRVIRLFLILVVICALWQIFYGYNQLTMPWHSFRDNKGIFLNTGVFGHFLAVSSIVGIACMYQAIKKKKIIVLLLMVSGLSLMLFQLVAVQSRASWLALIAGIFVMLFILFETPIRGFFQRRTVTTRALYALSGTALIVLSAYFLYSLKEDSANGRILIWEISAGLFRENAVAGAGINGFEANYMNAQAAFFSNNPNHPFKMLADDIFVPFNEFIKIAIEQGIIGLLFMALLLYLLLFRTNITGVGEGNSNDDEKSMITAAKPALVVLLVVAFFSYPFENIRFNVLFVFFIALLSRYSTPKFTIPRTAVPYPVLFKWIRAGIPVLFVFLFLVSTTKVRKFCVAVNEWDSAMKLPSREHDLKKVLFESAYPELRNNPVFLGAYGRHLQLNDDPAEVVALMKETDKIRPSYGVCMELGEFYEKTGNYKMAIACWNRASDMVPVRFEPLFWLAVLYHNLDNRELAREKARLFMEKKIKVNSPALMRMRKTMEEISGK